MSSSPPRLRPCDPRGAAADGLTTSPATSTPISAAYTLWRMQRPPDDGEAHQAGSDGDDGGSGDGCSGGKCSFHGERGLGVGDGTRVGGGERGWGGEAGRGARGEEVGAGPTREEGSDADVGCDCCVGRIVCHGRSATSKRTAKAGGDAPEGRGGRPRCWPPRSGTRATLSKVQFVPALVGLGFFALRAPLAVATTLVGAGN